MTRCQGKMSGLPSPADKYRGRYRCSEDHGDTEQAQRDNPPRNDVNAEFVIAHAAVPAIRSLKLQSVRTAPAAIAAGGRNSLHRPLSSG